MLTPRQHMKLEILQKCAEAGLTPDETCDLVKQAADALEKEAIGPLLGALASGGKELLGVGKHIAGKAIGLIPRVPGMAKEIGMLALVPTALAGGAAGHLLAAGTDLSDEDIREEKQRELIAAYRQAAERANRNRQISHTRADRPRAARSLV